MSSRSCAPGESKAKSTRGLLVAGVVIALTFGPLAAVPLVASAAATASLVASAFSEGDAKAAAAAQGTRVEVESLRSETDQVFANPDGSTTREQNLEPVRVRRGGQWLDVDSTLVRQADGTWAPKVSADSISFSGGGTGVAVSLRYHNVGLKLTWPQALPAPVINGSTATYPEVYPGVDLQLGAVGTSFTQHLVVKNATAAKDPRVRTLTLAAKAVGGALRQVGPGYEVDDAAGRAVLQGQQPVEWDSRGRSAAAVGSGLDDGDHQAAMELAVGKGTLTVNADTTLLDDPATVFPVVLDPTSSPAIYNWTMVDATYPTTSYYDFADADQGVGYNAFSGVHTKRIYLSFPTSAYIGKVVSSATLRDFETYSAACTAGTVYAYLSNDISSGTTWNAQPAKITGALSGWSVKAGRSDCLPGGTTASWAVTSGVQNRVSAGAAHSTFVLQGASETDYSSWMRFAGPKNATTSYRPVLSVTYDSYPTAASASTMWVPSTSTACHTTASGAPSMNAKVGASESMIAKISDPDGGNVTGTFVLQTSAGSLVSNTTKAAVASGSTISLLVPSTLADGGYRFNVKVSDGTLSTSTATWCYFTLDSKAPPTPTITATPWVQDVLAPNTATTGTFTMTSAGSSRIWYHWASSATALNAASDSSGKVTASATQTTTLDTWDAQASDAAGNTSGIATFVVKRTQPGKLAEYLFNGRVPDSTLPAHCNPSVEPYEATCDTANTQLDSDVPLSDPSAAAAYKFDLPDNLGPSVFTGPGQGRWGSDPSNQAIQFDGASAGTGLDTRPLVSEHSFAIGAWVLLGDATQSRTVLAQERDASPADPANPVLAYDLGYDATADKFTARLMDSTGALIAQANDSLPAYLSGDPTQPLSRAGGWIYLAMVYDESAHTLRLDSAADAESNPIGSNQYTWHTGVNTTFTGTPAAGVGAFDLGSGSSANGNRAPWSGPVDNLALWQGVPATTTLTSNSQAQR